jgi:hypothetical protein
MQPKGRTSFDSDVAGEIVNGAARRSNQQNFRAGLEPVNEPSRLAQTSRGRG